MQELQRNPDRFPRQHRFGGGDNPPGQRGNCFQVCLAALLNLPLVLVPHFYDTDESCEQQHANIARWLAGRGWFCWTYAWADMQQWQAQGLLQLPSNTLAIFSGESPRGPWQHAVIGRFTESGWELAHDPHPDNAGLVGQPETVEIFAPLPWVGS